jgi:hypothetical protein
MKKSIILVGCILLTSCASLRYPNWQQVTQVMTVYKQPCQEVGIEDCSNDRCEITGEWFQKRATTHKANRYIWEYDQQAGKLKGARYYYCGTGIPLNMKKPSIAYITSNIKNPALTEADLDQATKECQYEVHKDTLDSTRENPSRVYVPTNDLYLNINQLDAIRHDQLMESIRKDHLEIEKQSLVQECLNVRGFIYIHSTEVKDLAAVDKYCPDRDTVLNPCFIPAYKQ